MRSILLVEDDLDQLAIRKLVLAQHYRVLAAATCAEAIRQARLHRPAVVVLDLGLPRLADGIELLARLREELPYARFIALSGSAGEEVESLGLDAFLLKPCPSRKLIDTIAGMAGI